MLSLKIAPNLVALGFGAADGVVKNADLAASRTLLTQQRSVLFEGGGLVVGLIMTMLGAPGQVGEALTYAAGGLLAQRGGMAAGLAVTKQGPGRESFDAMSYDLGDIAPVSGAYGGGGDHLEHAIYPARREPAGILG
jgi:hypothetical protein